MMKLLGVWSLALALGLFAVVEVAEWLPGFLNKPAVTEHTDVKATREAVRDCVDMGFSATVETVFDNGVTVGPYSDPPITLKVGRPVRWSVTCHKPLGV